MKRILLAFSVLLISASVQAQELRLGIVRSEWAETRLPYFPYNAATGNLRFKDAHLTSFLGSKTLSNVQTNLGLLGTRHFQFEAEGGLHFHSGLQDHTEISMSIMTRTLILQKWNGHTTLGWANGFSYALEVPKFERGPDGTRGQDTVPFQYYMGFELSHQPQNWDNIEVFARLHHRSGIYGVISPDKTGSNYLGLGVRYIFN